MVCVYFLYKQSHQSCINFINHFKNQLFNFLILYVVCFLLFYFCFYPTSFLLLSLGLKWSEVAQSYPTLCNPIDCSLPGSSIHGLFQARILEWVAILFSRWSWVEWSLSILVQVVALEWLFIMLLQRLGVCRRENWPLRIKKVPVLLSNIGQVT